MRHVFMTQITSYKFMLHIYTIKLRTMTWAGYLACVGEMENSYRNLSWKTWRDTTWNT